MILCGRMDKASGGESQALEAMPGLRARMISKEEFGAYASQIRNLPENGFNTSLSQRQKGSHGQRKGDLKEVRKEMKGPGEHEHIFVAFNAEDKVVGFLAVRTTPAGSIAEAQELWTDLPGQKQRAIAHKLFGAARSYLNGHGYPRLTVKPEHESRAISLVRNGEDFHRFVRKGEAEVADMIEEMSEPANEDVPKVADDKEPQAPEMREAA
jgi:hypothetical protein